MPLFIVDTIVQERRRYIIEANELEHAYDEITMRRSGNPRDDFVAISEKDLGEIIVDGREISNEQFNEMVTDPTVYEKDEMTRMHLGEEVIRKINYADI